MLQVSPTLAAILDSEKAKPIASSQPGKIVSTYQELSKNAKKNDCYQRLHTSAQILWASASGLIIVLQLAGISTLLTTLPVRSYN